MKAIEFKFERFCDPEVRPPTYTDFISELEDLCNRYDVCLVADREENIMIKEVPRNKWVEISTNRYFYGEWYTDLSTEII